MRVEIVCPMVDIINLILIHPSTENPFNVYIHYMDSFWKKIKWSIYRHFLILFLFYNFNKEKLRREEINK